MQKTHKGTKLAAEMKLGNLVQQLIDKQEEIKIKTEIFNRSLRELNDEIASIKAQMKMNASLIKYGWIYAAVSSTDCDCVQSYYVAKFQSIKAYFKFCDNQMEWAEGPTYISCISKAEYDEERRQPTRSRDRIMEAYENGNGSSIIV